MTAALLAGLAAALLQPSTPRPPRDAGASRSRVGAVTTRTSLLLALGVLSVWMVGAEHLVLLALAAGAGVGVGGLVARRRRRRTTALAADRVLEGCTVLAGELRAGRSPEAALAHAARTCPELGTAVRASALGADVPSALRARAGTGARSAPVPDLRLVAAAWQVAHRTGDGLGQALTRVATDLREARATRRVVEAELASARATARLLLALPGLALLAGSGAGGSPWVFLTATPLGLGCLAGGVTLALLGLVWIEAIADDVERGA